MSHHKHKKFSFGRLIKSIGHELKHDVSSVTHTGLNLVRKPMDMPGKVLNAGTHVLDNLGMPLLIVGGIVAVAYLTNRK